MVMRAFGVVDDHRRRAALTDSLEEQAQSRRVRFTATASMVSGVAINSVPITSNGATALGRSRDCITLDSRGGPSLIYNAPRPRDQKQFQIKVNPGCGIAP